MQYEQYKEIDGPLSRDQDIRLLKEGAKERREIEKELGKEGHGTATGRGTLRQTRKQAGRRSTALTEASS